MGAVAVPETDALDSVALLLPDEMLSPQQLEPVALLDVVPLLARRAAQRRAVGADRAGRNWVLEPRVLQCVALLAVALQWPTKLLGVALL